MHSYLFPPIYLFILREGLAEVFSPDDYLWLGISFVAPLWKHLSTPTCVLNCEVQNCMQYSR